MILLDTSVVLDFARTRDVRLEQLFKSHSAAICGITRAEVLHGTRNPADRQGLLLILNSFSLLNIPDTLWDVVGDNLASLRARGTPTSLSDAAIATVAIANNLQLWTRDRHFLQIQAALPALQLFQPPP